MARGWLESAMAVSRLVMANINAHLMEATCSYGHVVAACGNPVNVVEFLYGLVSGWGWADEVGDGIWKTRAIGPWPLLTWIPSSKLTQLLNLAIYKFIVDLPIKNIDFPYQSPFSHGFPIEKRWFPMVFPMVYRRICGARFPKMVQNHDQPRSTTVPRPPVSNFGSMWFERRSPQTGPWTRI